MKKVAISCAIGVIAGLALAGAYFAAPYAGVSVAPATLMIAAAIVAFGSSVAILTLSALSKPEKKDDKRPTKRLSELADGDYAHFPTTGVRIVLRPDSVISRPKVLRSPRCHAWMPAWTRSISEKKCSARRAAEPDRT